MNSQNYIPIPALLLVVLRDYIRSFTELEWVFCTFSNHMSVSL